LFLNTVRSTKKLPTHSVAERRTKSAALLSFPVVLLLLN